MKMMTLCIKCYSSFNIEIDNEFFEGKQITCPHGHNYYYFPESPKYPFLFQLSIRAFRNGYYSEAFQALYSGFESFKEEYVGIHYYSQSKNIDKVTALMKRINRSEKIDGAFTLSYAEDFGELPKKMPNNLIEKRNKIIHSGDFPTKEIITKMGNWIFSFVLTVHEKFNKNRVENFDTSSLVYTSEKTTKKIADKGFNINNIDKDFNVNYVRQSLAITAISPNIILNDTIDNPYEYFVSDPLYSSAFDQVYTNQEFA
ncbi:hypothetical protein [Enterococcus hermanniensis]|uniref:Uncharacterized protein n=1 Tax=Enterococcus hermanniensis TaxID=249189 RepID=A0A1L8TLU8_9ENTE|nr:hypothetical protein [Enterococcus hermanniensis]OJG45193.1 hypothetical protein RV04_GL002241 [Enterococcus hermanniensis]